jgi:hypothetical protein
MRYADGADPTGVADATSTIQSAVNAACPANTQATPGLVYIPAGNYKVLGTVSITCNARIVGAGKSITVLQRGGASGDLFYWAKSPVAPYLTGGGIAELRIYRTDNPSSGAGVHLNNVQLWTCDNVEVDGEFYGFQVESGLNNTWKGCSVSGSNTAAGSALWKFNKSSAGGSSNNSENTISDSDSRAQNVGSYTYGILMQNSDGLRFCCHLYGASVSGLEIQPATTADKIDNLDFGTANLDTNGVGVRCLSGNLPGGYSTPIDIIKVGMAELSTTDGIQNSCSMVTRLSTNGGFVILNGRDGVNLSAGSRFDLSHTFFDGNNNAGGGSDAHIVLSGTVAQVNCDGAQFMTGTGAHQVPYDIDYSSGTPDYIHCGGIIATGASTGTVNARGGANYAVINGSATDGSIPP